MMAQLTTASSSHSRRRPLARSPLAAEFVHPASRPTVRSGETSVAECGYAVGDLIASRFRLLRLIGHGGMGSVYRAHDRDGGRSVAVKLVPPDVRRAADADHLLAEGLIETTLLHPHIVRAIAFGRAPDCGAYLAMEWLRGRSLGDWLAMQGSLSAVTAVRVLLPVALALSFAHGRGVVHLDLKPHNIFVAKRGKGLRPVVIDFGLARSPGAMGAGPLGAPGVMGSPGYMAPEQLLADDEVDERADVWAFSVVLYEAVAGRPAFDGHGYLSRVTATLEQDVLPTPKLLSEAEGLWPILARGLIKQRRHRYRTMDDMAGALASWLIERGASTDIAGNALTGYFGTARRAGRDASRKRRST